MIRWLGLGMGLLAGLACSHTALPEAVEPADIPAYRLVQEDLAVGGQPAPWVLRRLKDMGFRTVVNLRTEREGAVEEGEVLRELGLDYVWVPVTPSRFSMEDVEAVERVLDDPAAGPVLLHCASSNRVGGVWAVIQARRGRTPEEAEAEGRSAGLRSPSMVEAVHRVLNGSSPPS